MSFQYFKALSITDRESSNIEIPAENLKELFNFNLILNDSRSAYGTHKKEGVVTKSEYQFKRMLRTDNIFLTDQYNELLSVPISILDRTSDYKYFFIIPRNQTPDVFYGKTCGISATVAEGTTVGDSITITIPIVYEETIYNVDFTSVEYTYLDVHTGQSDTGIRFIPSDARFSNNSIIVYPVRLQNGYIALAVLLRWHQGTLGTEVIDFNFEVTFNLPISTYPLRFMLQLTREKKRKDLVMIVDRPIYKLIFIVPTGNNASFDAVLADIINPHIKLDEVGILDSVSTASCFLGPIVNVSYLDWNGMLQISGGTNLIANMLSIKNGDYPLYAGLDWYMGNTSGTIRAQGTLEDWYNAFKQYLQVLNNNATDTDGIDVYHPYQYQIDIYELYHSHNEMQSTPQWWADERPAIKDRLTIRRFNVATGGKVETFTYGQCLYDHNLFIKAQRRGSLGFDAIEQDLSAIVRDTVVCDMDIKGSQIYATSFEAAGIDTDWDKMTIFFGEFERTIVRSELTPETALLIYTYDGIGEIFIDTANPAIWVKATAEGYAKLVSSNYAQLIGDAYGDTFEQTIQLSDLENFTLKFTYDGNDVTYDYCFHLVGRDNPFLHIRKPEFYNNYVNQTGTLPIGFAG